MQRVGQWNRFRIRMIGERVSVWLNGKLVVENVVLTLIGGVLGWVLAGLGLRMINAAALIPYTNFELNLRVVANSSDPTT